MEYARLNFARSCDRAARTAANPRECAMKGMSMLTVLILAALYAALYAAWRAAKAVLATLRELPRSNDDMVFF